MSHLHVPSSPDCAAAARETGPRRPVSTPSIRCSELRLERLTPGKKLRRKGSPRSEGTSRHSYVNYCRPYRTGGLQMSSTRCFRVSGPENGRRCRGAPARGTRPDVINAAGRLENGAEVSVQIASVSARRRRYPSGYLRPRRGDDPGGGWSAEYRAEPSPGNERPGGRDGAGGAGPLQAGAGEHTGRLTEKRRTGLHAVCRRGGRWRRFRS